MHVCVCSIKHPTYVVIMHTTITNDLPSEQTLELWKRALLVTSFHNLTAYVDKHAPRHRDGDYRWVYEVPTAASQRLAIAIQIKGPESLDAIQVCLPEFMEAPDGTASGLSM